MGLRSSLKTRVYTAALLAVTILIVFAYSYYIPHPRGDFKNETRYIIVRKGESLGRIAAHLEEIGAISSKFNFVLAGKIFGKSRSMKSGRYAIKPSYSIARIMGMIAGGEATPFNITIPEGYTLAEIAGLLQDSIGLDPGALREAASDPVTLDTLGIEAENLEGYLSPSTYNFFYEQDAASVVTKMLDNFYRTLPDSFEFKANRLGLTFHEAVTLASMIEEEAMIDSERSVIAAVFLNRLRKRMRLECDPTVIYAIGGLDRPLLRKDLKYESPYNTYMHFGLPPGPISNPGVKSLEAAVNPSDNNYLYFVARGDGSHVFSYTLKDHVNATNRMR